MPPLFFIQCPVEEEQCPLYLLEASVANQIHVEVEVDVAAAELQMCPTPSSKAEHPARVHLPDSYFNQFLPTFIARACWIIKATILL
jgi:hypothetical protein